MKTIRFSLLAIAVSLTTLFSCSKSDVTPTANNATTNSLATRAAMDHSGCGMHCTCDQVQYGAPGGSALLDHFFKKTFPSGFPVGSKSCGNGYTVWVSNAAAVTNMLPMTGKPAVLTQDYKDWAPNNSLVGELITLCCNMDLEENAAWYNAKATPLRDMVIASGAFKGMSVFNFFKLANQVLGGCSTQYTAAQVDEVAKNINSNYLMHGKMMMDNGYLMCP